MLGCKLRLLNNSSALLKLKLTYSLASVAMGTKLAGSIIVKYEMLETRI